MRYVMKGLVGRLARQARVMVLFGIIAGLHSSLSMAWQTMEPAQMRGDLPGTTGQFSSTPLLTIGEGNLGNSFNLANWVFKHLRAFENILDDVSVNVGQAKMSNSVVESQPCEIQSQKR